MKTKRFAVLFLVLLMSVLTLTACDSTREGAATVESAVLDENGKLVLTYADGTTQTLDTVKTIVDASLNEELHLIVTYSDGTTEDKGYQGPASCTVTFVDWDGSVLSTEKTYAGLSVTAPDAPAREDYDFAGWDTALDKIKGDTTVTATYQKKPSFTVTFKDYDGEVIKTETVITGKDATPPADPVRADYNFAGWSGDYTAITRDVVITATYTEKGFYTVTFLDYNGLVLDTVQVKEGKTASTSVTPTRDGYTFRGWSGSLTNIQRNGTVKAQYALNTEMANTDNVFDISYQVSGNTVTLTLSLTGKVLLATFQGSLSFEGMTATKEQETSPLLLSNLLSDGTVSFVYVATTNTTAHETLFTVTLTKGADTGRVILTMEECADEIPSPVSYEVIGENIRLK